MLTRTYYAQNYAGIIYLPLLISYRFVRMSLRTGCLPWQKLTQKLAILTHACRLTVVGLLFIFVVHGAGVRRAAYLCLDYAKNVDKNWAITVSFIIHVNFDHAWAEHYPVTLIAYLAMNESLTWKVIYPLVVCLASKYTRSDSCFCRFSPLYNIQFLLHNVHCTIYTVWIHSVPRAEPEEQWRGRGERLLSHELTCWQL